MFATASFDLHVLSTPPAFILSQDQTLMFECLFPLRTHFWLLIPKKQRFVPFVFRRFLLFLRWSLSRASHPLEWKFIEFSGLFHCLIIKVLRHSLSQATLLLYHIVFNLSSTFFKVFKFFRCVSVLSNSLLILSQLVLFVKHFFQVFQTFLNCSNCLNFFFVSNSFVILSQAFSFVNNFFNFFSKVFIVERRWRDLNPRAGHPTYTLSRGTSSASWVLLLARIIKLYSFALQRKGYYTRGFRKCQLILTDFLI